MEPSIFTRIIQKEIPAFIIYEDDQVIAFLDVVPVSEGHVLVIPKKQIDLLWDLDDDDYTYLMNVSRKIANHMQTILQPKRVGMLVEGFGVPHAHVHLIPINSHFENTLSEHWKNKQSLQDSDGERLQKLLRL